jgi:hypothetical protein
VSTQKKSMARTPRAWAARNCLQGGHCGEERGRCRLA